MKIKMKKENAELPIKSRKKGKYEIPIMKFSHTPLNWSRKQKTLY
jgi:hypothetical protein